VSRNFHSFRIFLVVVGIMFTLRCTPAFAVDCTTVPTALPAGLQFASATPTSIYEGAIVTLGVKGQGFGTWTVLLCPLSGNAIPPSVSAAPNFSSSATVLNQTISAPTGTAGQYDIRVVNGATVYDTKLGLIVNSSSDIQYQPCSAPGGIATPNANLQCSFAPLSYRIALDAFGKGVADRFVVISVTIQNKNHDLEYVLQDIRGGFPTYIVSSFDKTLPQQISTKAEQLSSRAISIRLVSATAGVVSGISGFYGNVAFQEAANIFSGPAQTGLNAVIPDFSASELNFLNNHSFSSASAVISKGGTLTLFAFFDEATLPPSAAWLTKHNKTEDQWTKLGALSTYSGTQLRTLFQGMTVSASGNHVQQVTPPPTPTLKLFVTSLTSGQDFTAQRDLTIQGTGLDSVSSVELDGPSNTAIKAKLLALPNSGSKVVDPNVAVLEIPATAAAGEPAGKYEIFFILSDGSHLDTTKSITIPAP
jgi:hypothetical protein